MQTGCGRSVDDEVMEMLGGHGHCDAGWLLLWNRHLPKSLHGVSTGLAERDSDFCAVEPLFLFVPFSPRLPAHRLAAPCVKGGCSRTDCGNSRLASPGPLLPNQRGSHQSSAPPVPAHTNDRPNTHSHTKKAYNAHTLYQ